MIGPKTGRRTAIDLSLAFGIGLALLLLNLLTNFNDALHGFFQVTARSQFTLFVVNTLFFWLAVMMALAFFRWRESARKREELENVVASISPDTLLVVQPDRTIVMCTSAVRRLFGYSEEEVLYKKTDLLYYDRRQSLDHPREVYEALEEDGFHIGLATGRRKDGTTIPLEIIAGDLQVKGGGAVLLLRDISARIRMEKQQRKLEERALLAGKLESMGVLAGGAAHDFNNLLMVMQGYAELTEMMPEPPASVRENMRELQKACHRAMELCERLMSFTGETDRSLVNVNLTSLVRDAARLFEVSLDDSVTLEYDLSSTLPPVTGDTSQIDQVFMNLVVNAKDALGDEGGTIRVCTGLRTCNAEYLAGGCLPVELPPGDYVFLSVADTGCGMDDETLARICDPFFTTKISGHGLGLAAVLGIIRSHRGTLRIESRKGKGSTFTALFPVHREA